MHFALIKYLLTAICDDPIISVYLSKFKSMVWSTNSWENNLSFSDWLNVGLSSPAISLFQFFAISCWAGSVQSACVRFFAEIWQPSVLFFGDPTIWTDKPKQWAEDCKYSSSGELLGHYYIHTTLHTVLSSVFLPVRDTVRNDKPRYFPSTFLDTTKRGIHIRQIITPRFMVLEKLLLINHPSPLSNAGSASSWK